MQFIKNNKNKSIAILILLLVFGNCYFYQKFSEQKETSERRMGYIEDMQGQIVEYKDAVGRSISQTKTWMLRAAEVEQANKELYDRLKLFSKKPKNIETYTKVAIETKDSISAPYTDNKEIQFVDNITKDTIQEVPFSHKDEFLLVTGLVKKNSVDFDYTYKSSLEIVYKWKSNGWLKDPELVTDVVTKNPKEKIVGIEALKIEPPAKKWYETNGFKVGSGFVIGAGLATMLVILTQ